MAAKAGEQTKLSWREGLYLVGPDPLTSPYYSSGALIVAGVGYATPLFQLGLYALLFALAPIYIEAVLLTLSNGGTYVMTRYSLSHLGKIAIIAAAAVGVIISVSYVATAIVSLLSYSAYVTSLVGAGNTVAAIGLSTVPSLGFGLWVMPSDWRKTVITVLLTSVAAVGLTPLFSPGILVMLPPLIMLLALNNAGLRESVRVSKTIFLFNLLVMGVTILFGVVYVAINGIDVDAFWNGTKVLDSYLQADVGGDGTAAAGHLAEVTAHITFLPGLATLGAALIPAAIGSSILGASGVESVMNIPEELEDPRSDVKRIYMAMLSILMVVGGALGLLVFMVLPPETLVAASGYLLAALGETVVGGSLHNELIGDIWNVVIVVNAALMLLGATNTGFAGARGLWVTMARDNLLPRALLEINPGGVFARINVMFFVAIFLLAYEAEANVEVLERWYGASFGLVMLSGIVAFILLRRFKGEDRRVYTAPFNVRIGEVSLPVGALLGLIVISFALLGLYDRFSEQIRDLRALLTTAAVAVGAILLGYNHRTLLRVGYHYFRRVIDTVENEAIETEDRTIVVAVGGVRIGRLLHHAVDLARAQGKASGIPYRQIVVFHMTKSVQREYVYRIQSDSIRPAGIEGNVVRLHTELTEIVPPDIAMYLALVPNRHAEKDTLHAAMDELVDFHERHGFRGHIVLIGDYGITDKDKEELQNRLEGSTLLPVPV